MLVISKKLSMSLHRRNLSIQSCFPEVNSAKASQVPEDGDICISMEHSYDDIHGVDRICLDKPGISPALSGLRPSVESNHSIPTEKGNNYPSIVNTRTSNLRPHQVLSNSTTGLEMAGTNEQIIMEPSKWQVSSSYPSMGRSARFDEKLNTREADASSSFPLATVLYSGETSH